VGKPEGRRPLGRPRRRWVDSIRMDLVEVGWVWLRIGQVESSCGFGIEPSGSTKRWETLQCPNNYGSELRGVALSKGRPASCPSPEFLVSQLRRLGAGTWALFAVRTECGPFLWWLVPQVNMGWGQNSGGQVVCKNWFDIALHGQAVTISIWQMALIAKRVRL
jgi:hypothetical protein